MAEANRNSCVKCEEEISNKSEMLKCSGTCNKGLHYTCSSYNTSELQFIRSNKDNVKWYCDECSTQKKVMVNQ